MKKVTYLVVLAFLCLIVISSSVMAATGAKIDKKVNITQQSADGGNVFYGDINVTHNPAYFPGSVPFNVQAAWTSGSGLYLSKPILDYLASVAPSNAAITALLASLGSVGAELAYTGAAGVSQADYEDTFSALSDIKNGWDSEVTAIANSYAHGERGAVTTSILKDSLFVGTNVEANKTYTTVGHKIQQTTDITVTGLNFDIYEIVGGKYVSPLVLDMVGKGKLEASNGNHFPHKTFSYKNAMLVDFYNNGFEVAMEWVGPNDGLLVAPKADGSVDATCLFGTSGGFDNGFEKLSLYDVNNDKNISGDELNSLSIWQDKNQNGAVDQGEITTCKDAGITSISVRQSNYISSFVRNGKTCKMWDWWPTAMELKKVAKK